MADINFAVLILSNKRPNCVLTVQSLLRHGYSGKYYIIVDSEDPTVNVYKQTYGQENIIVFDKQYYINRTPTGDAFSNRNVVVFARNACFDIAKKLNLDYFAMFDDDYRWFQFRYPQGNKLKSKKVTDLDAVFNSMIQFMQTDQRISTVCMAQGGDFIGGVGGSYNKKLMRKAMNSFICSTKRPFTFYGRINQDYTTPILLGAKGNLFFTTTQISLVQQPTQKMQGGASDIYNKYGTYLKSFYSVMYNPSCVKVSVLQCKNPRIHHRTQWKYCVPKILAAQYKKK